jgi:vitamin B12 transporter
MLFVVVCGERAKQAPIMNKYTLASLHGAVCVLALPGGSLLAVEDLPETVVVANRAETPVEQIGSSVTVLDVETLEDDGILTLEDALRRSPGVFSESTGGQRGSVSSLFLRGTNTRQSHLQVDGVRLSDSTVISGNFLGSALLGGAESIEILRGPQSALYGGEAIGGVVAIRSARGAGDPSTRIGVEAGSFRSMRVAVTSQGETGKLAYTLHAGWEQTDNDARGGAELDHRQTSYAMRLDHAVSEAVAVGMTLRGGDARYIDSFGGENLTDYTLASLFAEVTVNPCWTTRLILGGYWEAYDNNSSFGNYATDAEKLSVTWENEYQHHDRQLTSFGAIVEHTDYEQDFAFPGDRNQYGFYANHVWEVIGGLTLTGGGRWEDYDDYGDEFTWRTAVAYELARTGTVFRASFGTAFRTPSILELNGGAFEPGNPLLGPEKSEGWDLGLEQRVGEDLVVGVTWFENEIENLIVDPFGAPGTNLPGKGNANGLELSVAGQARGGAIRYGLAYTYLQRSIQGQPDHVLDGRVRWDATDRLSLGAGISYVGERTLGADALDDYFLARIHGDYRVSEALSLALRVENAFDQEYAHFSAAGMPEHGRRLGVFAGAVVTF